jgi:hypothetical protein
VPRNTKNAGDTIWSKFKDGLNNIFNPPGYKKLHNEDNLGLDIDTYNNRALALKTNEDDSEIMLQVAKDKAKGFDDLKNDDDEGRIKFYKETLKNAPKRELTDEKNNKLIPIFNDIANTYHFLYHDGQYVQVTKAKYNKLINKATLPPPKKHGTRSTTASATEMTTRSSTLPGGRGGVTNLRKNQVGNS